MQRNYFECDSLIKNDFLKILHSDVVIISLDCFGKEFLLNQSLTSASQIIES